MGSNGTRDAGNLDFGTLETAAARMNGLSNARGMAPALLGLIPAFPSSRGSVPLRSMAHAPEVLLFGAALCLVSAPALLGSGLDDIQDDPLRVRQTAHVTQTVPTSSLVPAPRVEPEESLEPPNQDEPSLDKRSLRR